MLAHLLSSLVDHRELIAAVSLLEPGPQVALVLVRGGLGRLPLVRDGEILLKVGEQVHDERVLLVQLVVVGAFYGLQGVGVVAELILRFVKISLPTNISPPGRCSPWCFRSPRWGSAH